MRNDQAVALPFEFTDDFICGLGAVVPVEPGEQLVEITVAARRHGQDEFQRSPVDLDLLVGIQIVEREQTPVGNCGIARHDALHILPLEDAFHRHQAYGFLGLPIMTASAFLHDQLEISYAYEVPSL